MVMDNVIEQAVVAAIVDVLLIGPVYSTGDGSLSRGTPRVAEIANEVASEIDTSVIVAAVAAGIEANPELLIKRVVDSMTHRGFGGGQSYDQQRADREIIESAIARVLEGSKEFRERVGKQIVLAKGDQITVTVEVKR